jgi:hypothetical protein
MMKFEDFPVPPSQFFEAKEGRTGRLTWYCPRELSRRAERRNRNLKRKRGLESLTNELEKSRPIIVKFNPLKVAGLLKDAFR